MKNMFVSVLVHRSALAALVVLAASAPGFVSAADPYVDSWLTAHSGRYARIYTTDAARLSGASVTTWTRGSTAQTAPAYVGVQEIYSSADWVYIRTTGLGIHVMGPWYIDAAHTIDFPGWPVNQKALYRIPRTATVPATKTLTSLGAIGYFVDGVSMFDTQDGQKWTGSSESPAGTGYWYRDAYVNEGASFDPANAHQPGSGQHHYHASPVALRHLLGDHVEYDATTKTYSESAAPVTKHSPILGWVRDGHPIYGPYAYANPNDAGSGVRRMTSGYQLRNGLRNTDNLAATGRGSLPAWATRRYNVAANQAGPGVSGTYPLGRYMEDNAYLGDLGFTQGVDFDLDEFNGRFGVTPEFPGGTYAYFVSIGSDGTPVFPYNIGRAYYGNPTGSAVASISESVTTNFLGGPNLVPALQAPSAGNGAVTLTWSATEGGTYRVESTADFNNWTTNATAVAATLDTGAYTNANSGDAKFFRVARTALATYDLANGVGTGGGTGGGGGGGGGGGTTTANAPGGSASRGSTVTVTITLPTSPPRPPGNLVPTSITLGGTIVGTGITRPSVGTATATFIIPANAPTGAQNIVVVFTPAPTYTMSGALTIN